MTCDDEVETRKAHQAMLIIQALDPLANLIFANNLWRVSASIGIGETGVLTAGTSTVKSGALHTHADPNQAVVGYLSALQSIKSPRYVVVGNTRANRYEVRWNGAAFARVDGILTS